MPCVSWLHMRMLEYLRPSFEDCMHDMRNDGSETLSLLSFLALERHKKLR